MDEEIRVTVKALDSMINSYSMSQNDSMQTKQTTDDMAGNQREAIKTDIFNLNGKRVENDLNVYKDDDKTDQRDESDDYDDNNEDEFDEFVDQPRWD